MPNRMDSVIAKGTGVAKAVEARLHGLVGVFKVLAEQHGEAGALLKRVKADPSKRAELWPKIRQELTSHEKGELREVYPVLREYAETRVFADRHQAEADELSAQIDRIHGLDMAAPAWEREFDRLIQLVEAHVREEENEIFPAAQDAIGADRAKEIEPRFLAAKKQLTPAVG
jgi:hemerythrin superfamily protein